MITAQRPKRAQSGSPQKEQIVSTIVARGAVAPLDAARYFNAELHGRVCVVDGPVAHKLRELRE